MAAHHFDLKLHQIQVDVLVSSDWEEKMLFASFLKAE